MLNLINKLSLTSIVQNQCQFLTTFHIKKKQNIGSAMSVGVNISILFLDDVGYRDFLLRGHGRLCFAFVLFLFFALSTISTSIQPDTEQAKFVNMEISQYQYLNDLVLF